LPPTIRHPAGPDAGKAKPFQIISNDLTSPASQIAELNKKRWAVELLFKWVKQNLKIKRFMGQSRNAVMIQIYVAIIAYVLLSIFWKLQGAAAPKRLKDLLLLIRTGLFERPTIHENRKRRYRKTTENQLILTGLNL